MLSNDFINQPRNLFSLNFLNYYAAITITACIKMILH